MADIITSAEYKGFMGIDPTNTAKDTQISALIPAASRAIRTYTGRTFDVQGGGATPRTYQYDNSGFLDIDDCSAVTAVSTDAGVAGADYPLSSDEWTLMPQDDSEVFYYIVVQGGPFYGPSPQMGFTYNLDQMTFPPAKLPMFTVTGTWGWATVPADVKLATALTVQEMMSGAGGAAGRSEGLVSEAIEGYSRAWGSRQGAGIALAIPNRARDLLTGYVRQFI